MAEESMNLQPTLQSNRLILRPFEMADARDVQRLAGDRAIADTTLEIPLAEKRMAVMKLLESW